MAEKIYCGRCKHLSWATKTCRAPIDNWLSPKAKCGKVCAVKNKNNDCKDYENKVPE
jgi:hypothetical protein